MYTLKRDIFGIKTSGHNCIYYKIKLKRGELRFLFKIKKDNKIIYIN